jgi:hypothetical protein
MKSSMKLHPGRWAIGLIALMTVALAACGGSEQPTSAPVPTTPVEVQVPPTAGFIATSVPDPESAKPTAVPTPTLGAVVSARDTVRIVTSEEAETLGASSNSCS